MTTATLSIKNIQSKVGSVDLPEINWKAVCYIGFFVCLALLVFYVLQVNSLTRGSYMIGSYQRQINKLSQENKSLQVSFAENSFLGQALSEIQALDFQKNVSVRYIKLLDDSAQIQQKNKNI